MTDDELVIIGDRPRLILPIMAVMLNFCAFKNKETNNRGQTTFNPAHNGCYVKCLCFSSLVNLSFVFA